LAPIRRIAPVAAVVDRSMAMGERGERGSRTRPVTVEEPVLVPMSDADRAAAVSALTEILTAWWIKRQTIDRQPDA
jgi:hypothetical protein